MKLPRDISGKRLATLLRQYGYEITRQTGSHIRLTSRWKRTEHHITIPAHREHNVRQAIHNGRGYFDYAPRLRSGQAQYK